MINFFCSEKYNTGSSKPLITTPLLDIYLPHNNSMSERKYNKGARISIRINGNNIRERIWFSMRFLNNESCCHVSQSGHAAVKMLTCVSVRMWWLNIDPHLNVLSFVFAFCRNFKIAFYYHVSHKSCLSSSCCICIQVTVEYLKTTKEIIYSK